MIAELQTNALVVILVGIAAFLYCVSAVCDAISTCVVDKRERADALRREREVAAMRELIERGRG